MPPAIVSVSAVVSATAIPESDATFLNTNWSPVLVPELVPVMSLVKATVPVASGSVIVWSAVSVPANKISSLSSAALPSNITPLDVDTVSTLFVVVVPVTVRLPTTDRFLVTFKSRLAVTVPAFRDIVSTTKLVMLLPIPIDPDFIPFAGRSSSSTVADKNI